MIVLKKQTLLGVAGLLALTACTDPAYQAGGERERTGQGAAAGAAIGAIFGATRKGDRVENAVLGAAVGGAIGAAIGNQLDKQAAELRNDFGNSEIDVINTGSELIVRMPQEILFDIDSAAVRSGLRSDLLVLANNLNDYPNSTIQVVGHTDNTGSAAYTPDLSRRRAQSVAFILEGGGVTPSRIVAFGAGEDQPIASNLNAAGRAQNRRVEITIRPDNA